MTEWVEELTGNDWEEHCHTLLRYRYSPVNVQAVPAVQGDLGIDFWIRGSGDIYQCYGSEADSAKDRLRLRIPSDEAHLIRGKGPTHSEGRGPPVPKERATPFRGKRPTHFASLGMLVGGEADAG